MSEHPDDVSALESPDIEAARPHGLFDGPPRSVERIDRVLALLREEWLLEAADQRFFQMTSNLADRLGISAYAYILEDDALIEMLTQRSKSRREKNRGDGD